MDREEEESSGSRNFRSDDLIKCLVEPPTLQHISMVSLSIKLWTDHDILTPIESRFLQLTSRNANYYKKLSILFRSSKIKVREKLTNLYFPDSLKVTFSKIIDPIGYELIEYILNKKDRICMIQDTFKRGVLIRWTMDGVIDKAATTREVIESKIQVIGPFNMFKLACKYCLKDCVIDLWKDVEPFINILLSREIEYHEHFVFYWISFLTNDVSTFLELYKMNDKCNLYDDKLSVYANIITLSIYLKNVYSFKYFWNQLTQEEKSCNIKKWLLRTINSCFRSSCNDQNIGITEILTYLLCQLSDHNLQNEILQLHSYNILKCLNHFWSFERIFVAVFKIALDYLSIDYFKEILSEVAVRICTENATEVFLKLWLLSSPSLKEHFLRDAKSCSSAIYGLLIVDSSEFIDFMFNNVSLPEKRNVLINMSQSYFLNIHVRDLVLSNKLKSLDTLLKKYLLSDQDIIYFKSQIMWNNGYFIFCSLVDWGRFQSSEKFLHWGFHSLDEVQNFKENEIDKMDIYTTLIYTGQFEVIDQFLSWYFETREEKRKFKDYYFSECNSKYWETLLRHFSNCDNLESFISFTLHMPEEASLAKHLFLGKVKHIITHHNNFEFATVLLDWCLDSDEEVRRLRKELLLTEAISIFMSRLESQTADVLKIAIKWFSPFSCEEAATLKSSFDAMIQTKPYPEQCFLKNKKKAFDYLLNCYTTTGEAATHSVDDKVLDKMFNGGDCSFDI